jgi:hypothetical protein
VKYLIMIHSNPVSRGIWDRLSDADRLAFGRDHLTVGDRIAASGELVASGGLADPLEGKRVTVRDGRTVTTDGPFAEVKEHLAGFYLVECESMERAVEHAAAIPDAAWGGVEVRPLLDLTVLEP